MDSTYYAFIVLSNEFINIYTLLFIRAPPLNAAMIVFYKNSQLIENPGYYFFTIPSNKTGLELR